MSGNTIRWWISPPGPDETLRSLLDRAAALFECEPQSLWNDLHKDATTPAGDIDDPTTTALHRLAAAVGMSSIDLHRHRLPDAPWRLAPEARRTYCPQCHVDEIVAGRPITFRQEWTHVLRTQCPLHKVPLCLAQVGGVRGWPVSSRRGAERTTTDQSILDLIEMFGTSLEQSLFFGAPWPSQWRADPCTTRTLLLRVSLNLGKERAPVAVANVFPSAGLSTVIHGPVHLMEPVDGPPWDAFRAIADPAIRRAALWIAAWSCIPDLGNDLSPGWIDIKTVKGPSKRNRQRDASAES
jgi:hypothetical protein